MLARRFLFSIIFQRIVYPGLQLLEQPNPRHKTIDRLVALHPPKRYMLSFVLQALDPFSVGLQGFCTGHFQDHASLPALLSRDDGRIIAAESIHKESILKPELMLLNQQFITPPQMDQTSMPQGVLCFRGYTPFLSTASRSLL